MKEKTKKIIGQIHLEFDSGANELQKISSLFKKKADMIKIDEHIEEDGKFLHEIGFKNSSIASETVNKIKKISEITNQKQILIRDSEIIHKNAQKFSERFPNHKFILYSQVIKILEKYNLYIGSSELFKGDIPKKNINDIKDFINHLEKNDISSFGPNGPLCESKLDSVYKPCFYICAPKINFIINKNVIVIGKELFNYPHADRKRLKLFEFQKDIDDPIILYPVKTDLNEIGFIVVTKWGLESNIAV